MQTITSPPPIVDHADRDLAGPACAICKFSTLGTEGDPTKGICRRRPPAQMQIASGADVAFVTAWPEISADDWCGDFQRTWAASQSAEGQRA